MYDIVIVGAGLAGSALASLLDKRYKVLILDKRTVLQNDLGSALKLYVEDDIMCGKCCGGLLAPNAQKVLASTRWTFPKDILVGPQVFALKVIDINNKVSKLYPRSYININRKKLEKWLLDKAMKKAQIIEEAAYKSSRKINGGYEITYLKNKIEYKEKTRMIIGADGACSKLRKEFFSEYKEPQTYVAIQEWYKTSVQEPFYYSVADKDVTDFYSWIIPKENYLIVGSAIKDKKNANKKFEILKKRLSKHGFCFKKADLVKKEGSVIYRPRSLGEIALAKGDIALIGEAAGLISPSSSEGISYALKSGIMLAEEMNKDKVLGIENYKKRAKWLAIKCVAKNIRNVALYNSFFRGIVMKSNINTIKER